MCSGIVSFKPRSGPEGGSPAGACLSTSPWVGTANQDSDGRTFDVTLTKMASELLSSERVEHVFGIPAAELEPKRGPTA